MTTGEVTPQYLAGLMDATGQLRFNVVRTDSSPCGISINVETELQVPDDPVWQFLNQYFQDENIRYTRLRSTTGMDSLRVTHHSSVKTLLSQTTPYRQRSQELLNFIQTGIWRVQKQGGEFSPSCLYAMVRDIEQRTRKEDTINVTADDIADKFTFPTHLIPRVSYKKTETTYQRPKIEYLCGLFDGCATFEPAVNKSQSELGISLSITLSPPNFNRWEFKRLVRHLEDRGIQSHIHSVGKGENILRISQTDSLGRTLALLSPRSIAMKRDTKLVSKHVFPLLKQNHTNNKAVYKAIEILSEEVHNTNWSESRSVETYLPG